MAVRAAVLTEPEERCLYRNLHFASDARDESEVPVLSALSARHEFAVVPEGFCPPLSVFMPAFQAHPAAEFDEVQLGYVWLNLHPRDCVNRADLLDDAVLVSPAEATQVIQLLAPELAARKRYEREISDSADVGDIVRFQCDQGIPPGKCRWRVPSLTETPIKHNFLDISQDLTQIHNIVNISEQFPSSDGRKVNKSTHISTDSQDLGTQTPQKNTIELEGKVVESLPNAVFRVQIESGQIILAHIAGKLRVNKIRVLPGDKVVIEVTPYDLTRGRVIRRLR